MEIAVVRENPIGLPSKTDLKLKGVEDPEEKKRM